MFFFGLFPFFLILLAVSWLGKSLRGRHYDDYVEHQNRAWYPHVPDSFRPWPTSDGAIFRLADKRNGKLMLSDVVIATGLDIKEAEAYMDRMVDGNHVVMDVDDAGHVLYLFPEIIDAKGNTEEHGES